MLQHFLTFASRVLIFLWWGSVFLFPLPVNRELAVDWPSSERRQKLYVKSTSQAELALYGMRFYESENNAPRLLLRSKVSEVQRDNNDAFLTGVDGDFYSRRTGNTVRTVSDFGRCKFGEQRVELSGNVHIYSAQGYEFTMDTLFYTGAGHEMTTPDLVTIRGPDVKKPDLFLRGVGMVADVDYEHFILKKNVYSRKRLRNSKWMYIQSHTADFFTQEQRSVYIGNCRATMPRLGIQSDLFEVFLGGESERLYARGHVTLKSNQRVATAESARIEIDFNRIVLEGKAELDNEKGNHVAGRRITLYTDEDRIEVEGAEGRVK